MKLNKFLSVLALSGCSALTTLSPIPVIPQRRPIEYLPGSSFEANITNGLSNVDRASFYNLDYGIQYLPTNVFLSLKRASNDTVPRVMDELFFDHSERFGLLPNYINPNSPLPIGITQSIDKSYAPMSGINCASCHSSIISNNKNQFFLIDGAGSRFQIDVFIGEMLKSVVATLINPVEFEAFFERYQIRANINNISKEDTSSIQSLPEVVKTSYTSGDISKLINNTNIQNIQSGKTTTLTVGSYPTEQQLSSRAGMYVYLVKRFIYLFSLTKYGTNPSGSLVADSGPGRSNPWMPTKMMLADKYLHSKNSYKIVGGPINTPFMWDTNRQHWIFLLGNTNSMLERHIAQGVALLSDFNPTTFDTTLSIKNINTISQYVNKIQAPTWPEDILGPIDTELANRGKEIFKEQCLSCHDPKLNNQNTASAYYNYIDAGTDPNYYNGQIEKIDGKDLFSNIITPFMSKIKSTIAINEHITDLSSYEYNRSPAVWKGPISNSIIAKPLMGVWATPPYLHNGSVPTIRDLLNPDYMRPKSFYIGGFVYNSIDLGYTEDKALPYVFEFKTNCEKCVGNSNMGHNYGVNLPFEDKSALIEFLKSYDKATVF